MGNQLVAPLHDIPSYLHDIADYVYNSSLGGGKVFKTLQCLHDEGYVVVKVHPIRDPNFSLDDYEKALTAIGYKLSLRPDRQPSVLPLLFVDKTPKAAYLVRQYFAFNLYDRFHTHPFLTDAEKRWFAFQLLKAVSQLHEVGLCHGDIKTENVMCTSWNWLFLTDMAFYKPTFLPADNPADHSFFFDTGQRRRCYIAPERFYSTTANANASPKVLPSMDIFSAGCCIAEIFLEGDAVFDLEQLLGYRNNKYDPRQMVQKIKDPQVVALIMHMIQKNPSDRLSAKEYLERFTQTSSAEPNVFPSYLPFVYDFTAQLLTPQLADPELKIKAVDHHQAAILQNVLGIHIPEKRVSGETDRKPEVATPQVEMKVSVEEAQLPGLPGLPGLPTSPLSPTNLPPLGGGSAPRHHPALSVASMMSTVSQSVGAQTESERLAESVKSFIEHFDKDPAKGDPRSPKGKGVSFLHIDSEQHEEKSMQYPSFESLSDVQKARASGLTMIVNIVCACMHTVKFPLSKTASLSLLCLFSDYVDDEVRIGRLIPHSVALLNDSSVLVRAMAIETLAHVLDRVRGISLADAHIFPEYILPALSKLPTDPDMLVRLVYAQNISKLAVASRRFLDMAQYLKQVSLRRSSAQARAESKNSTAVPYQGSYDSELNNLQNKFLKIVIDMLTKNANGGGKVMRALLACMSELCLFFGRKRVNDELLPHLFTLLNNREWQLRAAFLENVVGVSVFIGQVAFQNIVLPCVKEALYDVQEYVVQRTVHSLAALCELRLFESEAALDLASSVGPLLCHPSVWIRDGAVDLILRIADNLGPAKTYCSLIPALQPYLKTGDNFPPLYLLSRETLIESLNTISRAEFMYHVRQREMSDAGNSGMEESVSNTQAPPPGPLVLDTNFDLRDRMMEYIGMLSQSKNKTGSKQSKLSEKQELKKYHNLSRYITLHSVQIEETVPEKGFISPIHMVQQDLFDSLGVQVTTYQYEEKERELSEANRRRRKHRHPTADKRRLSGAAEHLSERLSERAQPEQGRAARTSPDDVQGRHSSEVPVYIKKALQIPPPPPDLGHLQRETVSESSFFQNHSRLQYKVRGNMDPVEWRPKGILVASLHEHSGAITSIAVARDNLFLASASVDGTIKVWDCQRLKKTTSLKASTQYSMAGAVTSAVICDSSHSIVAGSDQGELHVFKVEVKASKDTNKYGGTSLVRKIDTGKEGGVQCVDHFNTITESLCVYGTERGFVHGLDLRAEVESWLLRVDPSLGYLSAMRAGPGPYSLVAGTSRGFLLLWDLRFQLPVQIWRHVSKTRITNILAHTEKSILPKNLPGDTAPRLEHPVKGPLVFVSSDNNNSVSAFDLYTGECRTVFRVSSDAKSSMGSVMKHISAGKKLEKRKGSRLSAAPLKEVRVSPLMLPSLRSYLKSSLQQPVDDRFTREIEYVCSTVGQPQPCLRGTLVCKDSFVLTAGTDRVIRYWDLKNPASSYRVSSDDIGPYDLRYHARLENNTAVWEEVLSTNTEALGPVGQHKLEAKSRKRLLHRRGPVPPPSTHKDAITELKALEFPQPMIVSGSRDGMLKVWI